MKLIRLFVLFFLLIPLSNCSSSRITITYDPARNTQSEVIINDIKISNINLIREGDEFFLLYTIENNSDDAITINYKFQIYDTKNNSILDEIDRIVNLEPHKKRQAKLRVKATETSAVKLQIWTK